MIYDIIIVGAGPCGLTLATLLHKTKKILIIDSEDNIGGCHRVQRINNFFSEHSPRVYSDAYVNLKTILNSMDLDFSNYFTKYNFNITEISNQTIFSVLSWYELTILIFNFFIFLIDDSYGKSVSMKEFTENFQPKSREIIDRICRLTDGSDYTRFTLNHFFQLLNQQSLYSLYQPKIPNDLGLFKDWKNYLEPNVDFLLNTKVQQINSIDNVISNILTSKGIIEAKKFLFAIPPISLVKILENSAKQVQQSFGNNLRDFAEKTEYLYYPSFTFHWNSKLNLPKVYGFPKSYWGIAFVITTDYMNLKKSKTCISTTITISDSISPRINKSAKNCSIDEMKQEVYLQLQESFPNLPIPDTILFNDSQDSAFVTTPWKFMPSFSTFKNLFNIGTQNGNSTYSFTSMESAVTNAMHFVNKKSNKISSGYTIRLVFLLTLMILVVNIYLNKK